MALAEKALSEVGGGGSGLHQPEAVGRTRRHGPWLGLNSASGFLHLLGPQCLAVPTVSGQLGQWVRPAASGQQRLFDKSDLMLPAMGPLPLGSHKACPEPPCRDHSLHPVASRPHGTALRAAPVAPAATTGPSACPPPRGLCLRWPGLPIAGPFSKAIPAITPESFVLCRLPGPQAALLWSQQSLVSSWSVAPGRQGKGGACAGPLGRSSRYTAHSTSAQPLQLPANSVEGGARRGRIFTQAH